MTDRKRLVKKLDDLCRKILRIRDQKPEGFFKCISCQRVLQIETANVGHYISRRYESLRWDLRNINLQCPSCNKWLSGNLIEYRKALIEIYGEKKVEEMERFYRESPGYTVFDLELKVKQYEEILAAFKRGEE